MTDLWLQGLGISLVGGGVAVWLFLAVTSKLIGLPAKPRPKTPRVPGWLTGIIERTFFFMLMVFGLSGIVESGLGWLALKLAANWQRYDVKELPSAHTRALLALLAGLISLAFAFLGGSIATGKLAVGI